MKKIILSLPIILLSFTASAEDVKWQIHGSTRDVMSFQVPKLFNSKEECAVGLKQLQDVYSKNKHTGKSNLFGFCLPTFEE